MNRALLLAAMVPALAYADLYRWVDPVSGSIKYSNSPPASREAGPVQVVPYREAGVPPAPAVSPAAPVLETPSPGQRAASAESVSAVAKLEMQWRGLLKIFSTLPERPDFERSGSGLRQQLQSYETVVAELDRRDPAGAARRRVEEASVLERVRKGLEAQFGGRLPPVSQ
jgi:hypothetical protein